jgi:hypothetical protein
VTTWQVHVVNGVVNGVDLAPSLEGFSGVYHYPGGPHEHFDEFVPEIEIIGPKTVPSDGWVELGLELEHGHDTTVYLEAISGYLPKTRITTAHRKATFKVCALGLSPGDELRVKAGFKFYTGRGEAVLEIA